MSWRASQWAIGQRAGSGPAKACILVLAEAAHGKTGACTLSHATIAERAELSPRAVWDAMAQLERLGLIVRRRRADRRGQRTSDLIVLQLAADAARTAPPKSQDMRAGGGRPTRTSCKPNSRLVQTQLAGGAKEPGSVNRVEEPGFSLVALSGRAKPSRKKPATELPVGCPGERDMLWARDRVQAAGAALDLVPEAEKFRDHHLSKDNRFSDWSAAWRTWINNALSFAAERRQRPSSNHRQAFSGLAQAAEILHEQRGKD